MPKFSDFTLAAAPAGADLIVGLQGGNNVRFTFTQVAAFVCPGQTAFGVSLQASANAAAARSVLGLIIGTNVQGASSNLEALTLVSPAADKLFYFTSPTAGALVDFKPALTAYTPTVSSAGGTITTSTSSGGWMRIGQLVIFWAQISVSNIGTGTGNLQFTLPFTAATLASFAGWENGLNGKMVQGNVSAGSNLVTLKYADATGVLANGVQIRISGFMFA